MKIINPNEIGSKISTLISESKEKFIAVSPYLDLTKWRKILINLEQAIKRGVEIKFYYREIKDKDFNVLDALGIKLIQIDGLHTKLYFNESEVIVSSMNLYEFSDLYSIDIALYFNEKEEYNKINDYYLKYIVSKSSSSKKLKAKKNKTNLDILHDDLALKFPRFKINRTSDYLFSKDLSAIFHLFIKSDGITIKYPKKDFSKELIQELEENIIEVYKNNPVIRDDFDFNNPQNYFYWNIKINDNNLSKTSELIVALFNMKIPESLGSITKKNII